MRSAKEQYNTCQTILRLLNGTITEDEFKSFVNLLRTDKEVLNLYFSIIEVHSKLKQPGNVMGQISFDNESILDRHLWEALVQHEMSAPGFKITEPPKKCYCRVEHQNVQYIKVSRLSLFSIIASTAAILLLIVFANLIPPNVTSEVATLSDSLNATWQDESISTGKRLASSSDFLSLRQGFAEITFDNQTRVTVESPAEFRILTGDQILLNSGKIYAQVPQQAYGFTVCTPNSKIIDLGTEFGINVNESNIEVHVTKGKVNFVSGFKGNRVNLEIGQGSARTISSVSGQIKDADYNSKLFVRRISSEHEIVWRGNQNIDLADIVGKGNGFGTGVRGSFIDPKSGKWQPRAGIIDRENYHEGQKIKCSFKKTTGIELVDGVFVPDASTGPVIVSSKGHIFKQAPRTRGVFWEGIINADKILGQEIQLNGTRFGTPERPALFMHANIGITFELNAIRKLVPDKKIKAFSSLYGISESFPNSLTVPYGDFWVLVDGELRFSQRLVTLYQQGKIHIPLSEQDSYLTLITTEAGKGTPSDDKRKAFNDWCVFGMPELILE